MHLVYEIAFLNMCFRISKLYILNLNVIFPKLKYKFACYLNAHYFDPQRYGDTILVWLTGPIDAQQRVYPQWRIRFAQTRATKWRRSGRHNRALYHTHRYVWGPRASRVGQLNRRGPVRGSYNMFWEDCRVAVERFGSLPYETQAWSSISHASHGVHLRTMVQ